MNSTYLSSHFWLKMIIVSFAILCLVWLAKTLMQKVTIGKYSKQAYPYTLNFISLLLFAIVLMAILIDHSFFGWNEKIFSLSQANFDEKYKSLGTAITIFGNYKVIFFTAALTSLWFAYKRQWRTLVFWLANLVIGYAITIAIKDVTMIPRPPVVDPTDVASVYSFPSGHIVRVVLLLTFFNMLIAPFITNVQKNINFFISGSLIILISLSRLFLDAHWLSDVIGSICLGLVCAITSYTLYQRKAGPVLSVKNLVLIFSASWLVLWALFYLPQVYQS